MKMLFVINNMSKRHIRRFEDYIKRGLLAVGIVSIAVVGKVEGDGIADSVSDKWPVTTQSTETSNVNEPTNLFSLSAVLMDAKSGRVLYAKDGDTVRANASTTKILTCILAIESGKLDELVTVSKYAASMPDVQLNIKEGEQYLLGDLLYSLMLESHNDVAVAIAEHIGGSVEGFAQMMNDKAKELGCENTYFITPNGLDATKEVDGEEKIHGTTATELATIMNYCIQNEKFLEVTTTASYTFSNKVVGQDGTVSNGARTYTVSNKNALLTMIDGVVSGKTGFTGQAGYCYVCAVESEGRTFTVALLGCGWPNNKTYKWADTKKLLAYGKEYYQEKDCFDYDMTFADIPVDEGVYAGYDNFGTDGIYADRTPAVSVGIDEEPLVLLCREDEEIHKELWLFTRLEAPVYEGDVVGYVRYMVDDQVVGQYDVHALETIEKKDFSWAFKCIINKFIMH